MKYSRILPFIILSVFAFFLATGANAQSGPEPAGWYAGDPHVHRSCGLSPESVSSVFSKMSPERLSVISLLADMGNGEVQNPTTDLPLINGKDDPISTSGQILHWDAEWHWDATYTQYPHQALGGHIVALGLANASQVWKESTFSVLDWAHQQNGIAGFAHMQYLDSGFPVILTCCTPVEYPVEVALGASDFVSEDVDDVKSNTGGMNPESFIEAYYRLLNSGFRPGFAAGTDYPCNSGGDLGSLLTYVQVAGGQMTYRNWIEGIAKGRTVVSRNGHNEFLLLKVNGTATPGDEIQMGNAGNVQVTVQWTATDNTPGTLELVRNGVVVASQDTTASPGSPATWSTNVAFPTSGWLVARRMEDGQHFVHTAAVYVIVNNAPIRASVADAQFYVNWMDSLLENTSPGGPWNQFFPTSLNDAQARYRDAKALFQQIAAEASGTAPSLTSIAVVPSNSTIPPGSGQAFTALGTYSNGNTLNISGQVKWSSSNPAVAPVNIRGVAAALSIGTTTITASFSGMTGSTILNVAPTPLTITTQALGAGTVGVIYSARLAATAGTQPYTWSIIDGSLPTGLSLSTAGSITGTPSTAGTFNFTVQVTDLSTPQQIATKPLSIVIINSGGGGCPCTIWPASTQPVTPDSGPDSSVELGVKIRVDTDGYITGIRFYKGVGNTGVHIGNLWSSTGTLLGSAAFSGETTTGWQQVNFPNPIPVSANITYVASYFAPNGHYADDKGYFASAVNSSPLHALADNTDGPNGVFGYGVTSVFPSSAWQSSNYWVDVVFVGGIGSPDTTPPSIGTTLPSAGAIGIGLSTSVIATFSEAIDPTTVNASTFQLQDSSSTSVAGSLAYNANTHSATFTPSARLAEFTSYTATVFGGSTGVKDLAGNAMVSNISWSFTTGATPPPPGPCPCSIWTLATLPEQPEATDPGPLEIGVKFRSDIAGTIVGIRFFKGTGNTGTHVGHIWTSTGTLLGSATFSQESPSGWQTASFGTPITIAPDTTYVAAYFAPGGHYAVSQNYFVAAETNTPPLHALQSGVDGGNGVFNYSTTASFPATSYQSSNYWIDVVFQPTDSTASPNIISTVPITGGSGVSLGTTVSAAFSAPMNASTINSNSVLLYDSSNNLIPANVVYDTNSAMAVLTPSAELNALATYTAVVKGGSNGVKDFNGNAMESDYSWPFTTGMAPASNGPGGPILIISTGSNPFTKYLGEILSAEGLNEYTVADVANVNTTFLDNYDIVILGDMSLTAPRVTMLTDWVNKGGNLIAMHPDQQLTGLLGITPLGSSLSDAYLKVQTSSGPGAGIVGDTIQFHGPANMYTLNGATSIATLYSTSSTSTSSPAVTQMNVGSGHVAAFAYDLARSIVYMRQGNPAWSGQKRDGQIPPTRSDDLYFGAVSSDPQPDWVDLNKVAIPQADEQQRLLANIILQMNAMKKPLPRFWYLPSGSKAAVVMTGDDHGNGGTPGRFDIYKADSPAGCSVADWQCVRSTSYIYSYAPVSDSQAAAYVADGFEIALHVNTMCSDWTPASLEANYVDELAEFATTFPSLPAPQTNRTHCIAWSDYDSQPRVELAHGIRFDTNYYYWPGTWLQDRPGMFTGSGMPMRFADRNGNLIDVYQATTQMTDESEQSYPFTIDSLLDNAVGTKGYYGVFTANMHNDSVQEDQADAIVQSAQSHGVPVVSSLQMLTWLDGRNSSSFGSFTWDGSTLGFSVQAGTGARNLQAMVPASASAGTLKTITRNGSIVSYSTQTIKGIQYAVFNAVAGPYLAAYGPSAVNVSSVTLSPSSLQGGGSSTGTVTLSSAAPATGAIVMLSTNNDAIAQAPASVTVAGSATKATFTITTTPVVADTTVSISAVYGTTKSANLTVTSPPPTLTSMTLSPATVVGGSSSTATVTLSSVARSGGAVVTLTSDNAAAHVPTSVTVSSGNMSANFTVTTSAVTATTLANISGTYGTVRSAALTVNPPTLSSVTLSPASVVGGTSSTGTVTLTGAAPTGGIVVTLGSDNQAAARVPTNVIVSAGRTTATFTVTSSPVASNTSVNILGTYGVTKGAVLSVNAPTASTLSLNPTSVVGGTNSTATVTITGAAPTGGIVVALTSDKTSLAQVPSSVTVSAGSTTATFAVTTSPVLSDSSATITATLGVSRTAALTVTPPASLSSITLNPTSLTGGSNSTGTATLTRTAPSGGALVTLQSSNTGVARVPVSITIAAGSTSATFTINTSAVAANTAATISGTYQTTRSATITVNAPTLSTLTLNPTSVQGGNSSTGTVTISGAAPTGGITVSLGSSNTAAAQVPGTVTILAGSTSATFIVTTSSVAADTSSVITGTLGVSRTATITVTAPRLISSLGLSPSSLVGGNNSTGTVTLTAAAPSGGAVVALLSNNTAVARVPVSVAVSAGSTTATFTVSTSAVLTSTSVAISGTYGITRNANLTVNPPTLSSITRSPSSVVGGNSSTGTVTLTGPAPTGGALVQLSSNNTSAAQVPSTVTIAAGSTSANFNITTSGVASTTSVTISAVYGATRTTTLTINVASLTALTLNPSSVTGGSSSTGTVTLNGAAPPSGAVVSLRSSRTAAQVPSSVSIPAGQTSASFTVTTSQVHGTSSSISGTYRLTTRSATLTIR